MRENLLKIIEHYGVINQLRQFNEESYELIEAIRDYEEQKRVCEEFCSKLHCDKEKEHIAEEIADVMVMLKQFQYYYSIDDGELKEIMQFKINRQLERMKSK